MFEIVYPAYLNHQYNYLDSNPEILERFKKYFSVIVEEPHEIKISLDHNQLEVEGTEETPLDLMAFQQRPEHAYQKDIEREPLLEVLDSIFKFQFIGSQKIREKQKVEAPDEYAEDA